jgi:Ca2+-binding EF-hand superfamily protein
MEFALDTDVYDLKVINFVFKFLDSDGDGKVSVTEMEKFSKVT